MFYHTEMPKVVGEFDATDLHERIDAYLEQDPAADSYDVMRGLNGKHSLHKDLVDINWARFFRSEAFENYSSDGQINELMPIIASNSHVDDWHPDTSSGLSLPEILTGASIYPTEFLVGRVAVGWSQFRNSRFFEMDFWVCEEGKFTVDKAIEAGDARVHKFAPGEMVKVPRGTLHRRSIPEGATGFRYFMRHFPRFNLLRSGTNIGRMRPY